MYEKRIIIIIGKVVMKFRMFISIVLNLVAFIVPLAFLVKYFGVETPMNPESVCHLAAIVGVASFAFIMSTIAGRFLSQEEDSLPK